MRALQLHFIKQVLRDILIHRYFDVNIEIVWEIVQSSIPELKAKIEQMIEEQNG